MSYKVTYFCYSKIDHLHFLMSLMILVLSNQKYFYTSLPNF